MSLAGVSELCDHPNVRKLSDAHGTLTRPGGRRVGATERDTAILRG